MIVFKTQREGCSCSCKILLDAFCKPSFLPCPKSGSGCISVEGMEKRNESIFPEWMGMGVGVGVGV